LIALDSGNLGIVCGNICCCLLCSGIGILCGVGYLCVILADLGWLFLLCMRFDYLFELFLNLFFGHWFINFNYCKLGVTGRRHNFGHFV
jgi:hypothetical protein